MLQTKLSKQISLTSQQKRPNMCLACCSLGKVLKQTPVQKQKPQCTDCKIKLKSWKDYWKHLKFCRQKSNTIKLPIRPEVKKQPKLKWKCQLCKRRYKTEKDLRSHQINRCEKRYLSNGWIVKI